MKFEINRSIEILERTPFVLASLLENISDEWSKQNEGADTWSPYDILGHLIHGETTDWIQRMDIILSEEGDKKFKPFDRFAQFNESKGKSLQQLIDEFKMIRQTNILVLKGKKLDEKDLQKTGIHPNFGNVTLENLLSTWVVHDLSHTAQMTRVMAKQYKNEVGPWKEYLPILSIGKV
jgi:uncharacterized damage-inducible protein DinB